VTKIHSIGTALPAYKHLQKDLFEFAAPIHCTDELEKRKLRFVYRQSGIESKYSVLPDFSAADASENIFATNDEKIPSIEERMALYNEHALALSVAAIEDCIKDKIDKKDITHLLTVSCTGLSAPGLDLLVMEQMGLPKNIMRTSVNFMGCYAAIHAMKIADAFCKSSPSANVVVVCTELCTLHFQEDKSEDNVMSTLLFGDGSAAMLLSSATDGKGLHIQNFYSEVLEAGKNEMAWQLSSRGFLMKLSGLIPNLIQQDFLALTENALKGSKLSVADIDQWCIHPGGRKIIDSIANSLSLTKEHFQDAYDVLKEFGNMSSPTVLFVLKRIFEKMQQQETGQNIFGAAFGPGLTMETFLLRYD
jgi:predicted naringenin-chalcone synthase